MPAGATTWRDVDAGVGLLVPKLCGLLIAGIVYVNGTLTSTMSDSELVIAGVRTIRIEARDEHSSNGGIVKNDSRRGIKIVQSRKKTIGIRSDEDRFFFTFYGPGCNGKAKKSSTV